MVLVGMREEKKTNLIYKHLSTSTGDIGPVFN